MGESESTLTDDRIISDEHLKSVCLYRQGSSCCKYIVYLEKYHNFYCAKKIPELKEKVDVLNDLKATGDNCEGLPYEKR